MKINSNDMWAIISSYPRDPIKLQSFDQIFTCWNIWKWWCKGRFIPMNWNTLFDEQVQYQLDRDVAAVGDGGKKIEMLVQDSKKIAQEVNALSTTASCSISRLKYLIHRKWSKFKNSWWENDIRECNELNLLPVENRGASCNCRVCDNGRKISDWN